MLEKEKLSMCPEGWSSQMRYINVIGIALGMKFLHSKGIIHRDLKPSNILLDADYFPLICDFGLSRITNEELQKYEMESNLGTILYKAPEIDLGPKYTFKVDVFSFGVMLYEMITNQRIPIKISNIEGVENQTFLDMCLSPIAEKRPDFNEICAFIGEDCFMALFNIIKTEEDDDLHIYDEILTYLDKFGDDPEALLLFGKIILKTNDQFRQTEARRCFSQSAAKGNSEAMVKLGEMFETEGNKEEALRYFKMAAEKNNVKGMKIYADKLYNGENCDENKAVAFDYYKKAAKKRCIESMYKYALMLYKGDQTEVNKEKASHYFKSAADKGHSISMHLYACMNLNGDGIDANKDEALNYFKKAADKDYLPSIFMYGILLLKDSNIDAVKYIKMASDKGIEEASSIYEILLLNNDCFESIKISNKLNTTFDSIQFPINEEKFQKFETFSLQRKPKISEPLEESEFERIFDSIYQDVEINDLDSIKNPCIKSVSGKKEGFSILSAEVKLLKVWINANIVTDTVILNFLKVLVRAIAFYPDDLKACLCEILPGFKIHINRDPLESVERTVEEALSDDTVWMTELLWMKHKISGKMLKKVICILYEMQQQGIITNASANGRFIDQAWRIVTRPGWKDIYPGNS